jgi:dipeptidyl aminopeptidase/acylaminoacyl peptidase
VQVKFAKIIAFRLVLAVALSCGYPAFAQPVSEFDLIDPTGIKQVRISPDGKHIAALIRDATGTRVALAPTDKLEFKDFASSPMLGGFRLSVPEDIVWLNPEVLVINFRDGARAYTLDGKGKARLGERALHPVTGINDTRTLVLAFDDESRDDLAIFDAFTGSRTRYRLPPEGKLRDLAFDRNGLPRAATMADSAFWSDKTKVSNWYRKADSDEWEKLEEFSLTAEAWLPMKVLDAPDMLAVGSRMDRDTYAVFSYNTRTRKMERMLAGYADQDVLLTSELADGKVEFVRTGGMKSENIWFDPVWAKIQADVDATFPGQLNTLSGRPDGMVLIFSRSDTLPGEWHIYDTRKGAIQTIGPMRGTVNPSTMRPMQTVRYTAKDGLEIPAYLTLPAGTPKQLPVIVMIHGGPTVRDYWGWDQEVQYLASRGYAVLQPQFRGSTGFGRHFQQAGYSQWGKAMQDDVTEGVNYLIAQGIADPARICIFGASYGGYAALWGLVKTPDLYRCGVSFAGVVDLNLMFSDGSDRNYNSVARELMYSRIGDPRTNKQQFDEVSPLKSAHLIKAPVLLMHGENDMRVPIEHSERMLKALQRSGKQVEWIPFRFEGHGVGLMDNRLQYLKALGTFFDKHLGKIPAP